MDFSFTEEQEIIRSSVSRFIREDYSLESRRKIVRSDLGMSREYWQKISEMGLLSLNFPEELGGLGGTEIDSVVIMEEFGRGLVVEPFFESIILSGEFLKVAGDETQKGKFIPDLMSGDTILTTAFSERHSRYNPTDISTTAKPVESGYLLNGHKSVVWGGPWANYLIVTTRTAGDQLDSSGISLFLVDVNLDGVSRRDYLTIDGRRASEFHFNNLQIPDSSLLGDLHNGAPIMDEVFDRARVALCAEAVGAMKSMIENTAEYVRTREQFDQPIGSFQAIQHELVDMFVAMEESVSATYMAVLRLKDGPETRRKAVSAAKAKVGKAARQVGKGAVQLHGGMGMTDELNISHYFKRLIMIDISLGDHDYHIGRYAGHY